MKRLLFLLFLPSVLAGAASVNTYTLYPTNYAVSGDTITASGVARTFAATTTASTIATNRTSFAALITNVFAAYGAYPAGFSVSYGSSTSLVFRGLDLTLVTASGATNWAVVVTNLAPATNFYAFSGPHYNMPGTNTANVKTNQANDMMAYLMDFATTNWFKTNSVATTNLLSIGVPAGGGIQKIYAPKHFYSITGTNAGLTNGYIVDATITNATADALHLKPFDTGDTNFGSLFFYNNTTNIVGAIRPLTNGLPGLFDSEDAQPFGLTDPLSIAVNSDNSAAILNVLSAVTYFPLLSGTALSGRYTNLWTGTNYWSDGNQTFAGGLKAPGGITASGGGWTNAFALNSVSTNIALRGTNLVDALAFTPRVNTSVANGNNAGVVLGTNVYVRIMGPSASYTLAGFAAEWSGAFHTLQLTNPAGTITIPNESGLEATAANRILTSVGGDLSLTNNPAFLQIIYDGAASRWRVITFSR